MSRRRRNRYSKKTAQALGPSRKSISDGSSLPVCRIQTSVVDRILMQATVDTSGVKVSSQQVRLQTGLRGVCLDGPLLDQCANLRSIALCLGKIWSGGRRQSIRAKEELPSPEGKLTSGSMKISDRLNLLGEQSCVLFKFRAAFNSHESRIRLNRPNLFGETRLRDGALKHFAGECIVTENVICLK